MTALEQAREHLEAGRFSKAREAALEALVRLGWLALCVATFGRFVSRGRVDGSLEYAV